jgi:HD-GYP domain-containing protein (c-di-GMP phosphodiesterase class II)
MSKSNKKTLHKRKSPSFRFLEGGQQALFERACESIFQKELDISGKWQKDGLIRSVVDYAHASDVRRYAIERARERTFKKLKSGHTQELVNVAIAGFRDFNNNFVQPCVDRPNDFGFTVLDFHHRYLMDILDVAQNWIYETLEGFTRRNSDQGIRQNVLDFNLLASRIYFGPKASVGWDANFPASEKISRLTTTHKASTYLENGLFFSGFPTADGDVIYNALSAVNVVDGGKLGTVPKDKTKCRVIMTEPSVNGALQLAAGVYLRDALAERGLKISGHDSPAATRNNLIASIASRFWESKLYATLDLKNASDSLSDALVRRLMPREWYEFMRDVRSEWVDIPSSSGSVTERLNVFCTMGNGFTFPLQTLIFTSLAVALRSVAFNVTPDYMLNQRDDPLGHLKVSVFGDDIIVPQKLANQMVDLLDFVGLVVNRDKSFTEGPFFESCGGDYYKGSDVTPCYVRDLKHRAGLSVAFNSLLSWSVTHNVDIKQTLYFIARRLYGQNSFNFVPCHHGPDQGILYPSVKPRSKMYTVFCVIPRTIVTMPDDKFGLNMYKVLSGSYVTEFASREVKTFSLRELAQKCYLRGDTVITRKNMVDSYEVSWTLSERNGRSPRYRGSTLSSLVSWWSTSYPGNYLDSGNGQRRFACFMLEYLAARLAQRHN